MDNSRCIFCKIIAKKIPAEIIFEDNNIIILQDVKPSAPFHHLIIPKEHIQSVAHLKNKDKEIIAELFFAAQKDAEKAKLKGYKTIFNVGREGGQIVDHLHLHLMGGWKK